MKSVASKWSRTVLTSVVQGVAFVRTRWYVVVGAGVLAILALLAYLFVGTVPLPAPPQSTTLLASDGKPIASLHGAQDRTVVPLSKMSPFLPKAVVATEDRTFYEHSGVSVRGVVRAIARNVGEGGVQEGGSTITQQYVRNAFASVGRNRTILRKVREATMAIKVERSTSKDKILELYLNTVYFGRGTYGAEGAARTYFAKPAGDLTLSEAAYVAGVIRSPERLQPDRSFDAAVRVRDEVLADMVRNGAITEAEAHAARAEPLRFSLAAPSVATSAKATFFVEYVRRQLRSEFGLTDAQILGGGLEVHTTLDLRAQDAADRAVATTLDRPDDPEVALVALDTDGRIRALVGGRDVANIERARGFNYAYQGAGAAGGRQAGSAFKPFTLASWVAARRDLQTQFPAPPTIRITSPQCRDAEGNDWEVSNFDRSSYGGLTVPAATVQSVNTVYAQMIDQLGPATVARLAERVGGWDDLPNVCSLALGSASVTPLEMARAFVTFAARGERPEPFAVTRIVDADGKVLAEREPQHEQVLDADVADTVNDVLQGVVANGGTAAGRGIGRPAAGKTGTTQNHVDAWFVGYTPTLATAVWMGYPPDANGTVPAMTKVHGRRVSGASFPASIWQRFMREAVKGTKAEAFVRPPTPQPSPSIVLPSPLEPSPATCDPAYFVYGDCTLPILVEPTDAPEPTPTRTLLEPTPARSPGPKHTSPPPSPSPEPSPSPSPSPAPEPGPP